MCDVALPGKDRLARAAWLVMLLLITTPAVAATITGRVVVDQDGNGVAGPSEPGLAH